LIELHRELVELKKNNVEEIVIIRQENETIKRKLPEGTDVSPKVLKMNPTQKPLRRACSALYISHQF